MNDYVNKLDCARIEKELPLGRHIITALYDADHSIWPKQNCEQKAEAMFNELVDLGYAKETQS